MGRVEIAQAIGMVGAPELGRLAGVSERAVYRARTRGSVSDTDAGKRLQAVIKQVLAGSGSGRGRRTGQQAPDQAPATPEVVTKERDVGLANQIQTVGLKRARRIAIETNNYKVQGELVPAEEVRWSRQQAGAALRMRLAEARRDFEGASCERCLGRLIALFDGTAADLKTVVSEALARRFNQPGATE